jgi:hypothetical protein
MGDVEKEPPAKWTWATSCTVNSGTLHQCHWLMDLWRAPLITLSSSLVCPGILQTTICMINKNKTHLKTKKKNQSIVCPCSWGKACGREEDSKWQLEYI